MVSVSVTKNMHSKRVKLCTEESDVGPKDTVEACLLDGEVGAIGHVIRRAAVVVFVGATRTVGASRAKHP